MSLRIVPGRLSWLEICILARLRQGLKVPQRLVIHCISQRVFISEVERVPDPRRGPPRQCDEGKSGLRWATVRCDKVLNRLANRYILHAAVSPGVRVWIPLHSSSSGFKSLSRRLADLGLLI